MQKRQFSQVMVAQIIVKYAPQKGLSDPQIHADASGVDVQVVNYMRMEGTRPVREPHGDEAVRVTNALKLNGKLDWLKAWLRDGYNAVFEVSEEEASN